MGTTPDAAAGPRAEAPAYRIRVRGRLGPHWAAWFDGMALSDGGDGTTVLHGAVVDQSALHGLLQKLRDLGLTLVEVTQAPPLRDHPCTPPRSTS